MADIRITQGTAWLGASGFGVTLNVYGQAPNSSPVLLGYTAAAQPGNGVIGNGAFQSTPWYLPTNGIGTYKVWAEHPNNSGVKSNEVTYYFDPDNYQGSGDPFDWNEDGIIQQVLIVPGLDFSVSGYKDNPSSPIGVILSFRQTINVTRRIQTGGLTLIQAKERSTRTTDPSSTLFLQTSEQPPFTFSLETITAMLFMRYDLSLFQMEAAITSMI